MNSGEEKRGKVLFVIAPENFRDEELFQTQEVIQAAGFETEVVSQKTGLIKGMLGGEIAVKKSIFDIVVADYQAIIFIGGTGAKIYFDDLLALNLAQEAVDQGKVVAAICIAPSILANAGLLSEKRAVAYASEKTNLKNKGAVWVDQPVVVDGKIITASGPKTAKDFGWKIVKSLREK